MLEQDRVWRFESATQERCLKSMSSQGQRRISERLSAAHLSCLLASVALRHEQPI